MGDWSEDSEQAPVLTLELFKKAVKEMEKAKPRWKFRLDLTPRWFQEHMQKHYGSELPGEKSISRDVGLTNKKD